MNPAPSEAFAKSIKSLAYTVFVVTFVLSVSCSTKPGVVAVAGLATTVFSNLVINASISSSVWNFLLASYDILNDTKSPSPKLSNFESTRLYKLVAASFFLTAEV